MDAFVQVLMFILIVAGYYFVLIVIFNLPLFVVSSALSSLLANMTLAEQSAITATWLPINATFVLLAALTIFFVGIFLPLFESDWARIWLHHIYLGLMLWISPRLAAAQGARSPITRQVAPAAFLGGVLS